MLFSVCLYRGALCWRCGCDGVIREVFGVLRPAAVFGDCVDIMGLLVLMMGTRIVCVELVVCRVG